MKTDVKFLKFGMKKESPVEEKTTLILEIQKIKNREKPLTFQFIYFCFCKNQWKTKKKP